MKEKTWRDDSAAGQQRYMESDFTGHGDNGIPLSEAVERTIYQVEKTFDSSKSAMHRGMYQ